MDSRTFKIDDTPDPRRVESIKEALAGFEDASGTGFRLDTGHRKVEVDGHLAVKMADVHVEGRHDDKYMRGYPILDHATLPDGLWQTKLFNRFQNQNTYGKRGARCFMPGLAFALTADSRSVDLLFCLACRYLYAFRSDEPVTIPLSASGVSAMFEVYFSLFPDQRSRFDA